MFTEPFFGGLPLRAWLGILIGILIVMQILLGKKILNADFDLWHRKLIPSSIIVLGIIHSVLGLMVFLD